MTLPLCSLVYSSVCKKKNLRSLTAQGSMTNWGALFFHSKQFLQLAHSFSSSSRTGVLSTGNFIFLFCPWFCFLKHFRASSCLYVPSRSDDGTFRSNTLVRTVRRGFHLIICKILMLILVLTCCMFHWFSKSERVVE